MFTGEKFFAPTNHIPALPTFARRSFLNSVPLFFFAAKGKGLEVDLNQFRRHHFFYGRMPTVLRHVKIARQRADERHVNCPGISGLQGQALRVHQFKARLALFEQPGNVVRIDISAERYRRGQNFLLVDENDRIVF